MAERLYEVTTNNDEHIGYFSSHKKAKAYIKNILPNCEYDDVLDGIRCDLEHPKFGRVTGLWVYTLLIDGDESDIASWRDISGEITLHHTVCISGYLSDETLTIKTRTDLISGETTDIEEILPQSDLDAYIRRLESDGYESSDIYKKSGFVMYSLCKSTKLSVPPAEKEEYERAVRQWSEERNRILRIELEESKRRTRDTLSEAGYTDEQIEEGWSYGGLFNTLSLSASMITFQRKIAEKLMQPSEE